MSYLILLITLLFIFDYSCVCDNFLVPLIVHQVYDYKSPSLFFFLSIQCIQHYLKPVQHILWVNNEGRFRIGNWNHWISHTSPGTWENDFKALIDNSTVTIEFITFPSSPPGNNSLNVPQHAFRSDFVRMNALARYGGVYIDTDAFVVRNMDIFRTSHFTLALNNVIHEKGDPISINNGVMLSSPNSSFIQLWMSKYSYYEGYGWDRHWYIPGLLALKYPDFINIEMSRISPISYGHHTALAAQYLTCGLYLPSKAAIWGPRYDHTLKQYTYINSQPNTYVFQALVEKYVLHMTMSQERYISWLRKNLNSYSQVKNELPSMLGHYLRQAVFGTDDYDYIKFEKMSDEERLKTWNDCRNMLGIQLIPEKDIPHARQQFMSMKHKNLVETRFQFVH